MSTTHYQANKWLSDTKEGPTYLALFRSMPDKYGNNGNEVGESSYIRQPVTFLAPDESMMRNQDRIDYPTALTDWGSVVAWGLYDMQSGGNMLTFDAFESVTPIPIGSHFFVNIEGLKLSVDL